MTQDLTIKSMTLADLERTLGWARAEGWNPGLDDAEAFYGADPEGFFLGCLGADPVSAISLVGYGGKFAFLGLYIVAPEFRGQGHGMAIWSHALETMPGRTIGLDGVVAQQKNYARSGFVLAHNNIRYGGVVRLERSPDIGLRTVTDDVVDQVAEYDTALFPAPRRDFLKSWLLGARSRHALCIVEDGALRGYGAIRACAEGCKIGPLFADDGAIADRLFQGLVHVADATTVFLDVPEPNAEARALAERHGLKPVFETARMYRGPAPDLDLGRIFGITTFELG